MKKNKIGIKIINNLHEYYDTEGNCISYGKHKKINYNSRFINHNKYGLLLWKVKIS